MPRMQPAAAAQQTSSPCQSCGACCAYDASWPRFTLEDDPALAKIPAELIAAGGSGMRCIGDRCVALRGEIGKSTACSIYDIRPDVCRTCQPGDEECNTARRRHGMEVVAYVPHP